MFALTSTDREASLSWRNMTGEWLVDWLDWKGTWRTRVKPSDKLDEL